MPRIPSKSTFRWHLKEYEKRYGPLEHSLFHEVGSRLSRHGCYSIEDLSQVTFWKLSSWRNDDLIWQNEGEVEHITKRALRRGLEDEERLKTLFDHLEGVGIPVASALLTVWKPAQFVAIDDYVWEVYHRWYPKSPKSCHSVKAYIAFRKFCLDKAREFGPTWTARRIEQAVYMMNKKSQ